MSLTLSVAFAPSPVRGALPAGAQVVHGNVAIAQAGGAMTLTQTSSHAVVNWQSFNIGAGESLRLAQAGANAAMLARVVGGTSSELLGSLQADGKLFLINPKGVLIGAGAVIDTAGFMASTLDVADRDFLAGGAMTFKGDSSAGIVNLGRITAREGNVMLFAHTVKNAGEINAPKGAAGLAAGTEVYLAKPDDASFVVKLNLDATTEKTGVENSGVIAAARARLEAAGGGIYELAVNQSGYVRATGVEMKNGRVILTADGGTVGVSGEVRAHNVDGSGGEILVGGDYRGENASVANAARTVVTASAKLDASATTAAGRAGRAIVWADDATRFLGTLMAKGSGGGFAEVSGANFLDFRPAQNVDLGQGGTLLLDPRDLFIDQFSELDPPDSLPGDPYVFKGKSNASSMLRVSTLEGLLATTDVTLDTSHSEGSIVVASQITWASNRTLRLNSGNQIVIDASITGGAGSTLALYAGREAMRTSGDGRDIDGRASQVSYSTIKVGTLIYGANAASASPDHQDVVTPFRTNAANFEGVLDVGTLTVDLSGGAAGVQADNSANKIGTFRTTGTGNLDVAYVVDGNGGLDIEIVSATSTANEIRIVTPGALRLLPNTSLNFGIETDVILASTGGAFTNNATAGANVFGSNGRYLIYSNSLAATTKGGLGGVNVFNHAYNPTETFPDSTRRFFFTESAALPTLTYAANNASRSYGDSNPAFTFTVSGAVPAHPVATSVTGAPSFTTTATQSSGVGSYTINIGLGSLFSTAYQFSFTPGLLTITPAPLMITANNLSRHLNHPNPTLTASYAGLMNGDTSAVVSGLQLSTTATLNSPSGNYPITASGGTAANYTIEFVNGRLTIGDLAPLTITANNASRLYGAANPTFGATFNGLVSGHDSSVVNGLQFNTAATQSSGVGTYAITPFGASATGYTISYVPGALTIERAPLTITANHASRTYGDANPAFSATFSGLVNGDTESVVSGLTFNAPGSSANAGAYDITPSGGTAANYALTFRPGRLQIGKASLLLIADSKTRFYGDANPPLTLTATGLRNGDKAEDVAFIGLHFTPATETTDVGRYSIQLSGLADAQNYNVNYRSGSLTILPRPITIVADNKTKVYGDPFPTYTTTITGLPSFANASAISNVKASLLADVADGVQTVGIRATSDANPNYAITYKFGQLTITPATLLLGAPSTAVRIYGRADELPSLATVGGLKYDDTAASIGLAYDVPAPTANVGTYDYGYKLSNRNYKLPDNLGRGTFYVEPAPLDLRIGASGRLYGDANPTLALDAAGLAFGQTPESVLKVHLPDATADVGVYTASPELTSQNYFLRSVTGGRFQINPRLITFEIDNVARYYGDANPVFTYKLEGSGFASFDSIDTVFRGFRTAADVTPLTNVGVYRIDPIFEANPNYHVSWSPGFLAIMPRPITLTINNAVAFGNDNAPVGFSPAGTGLDWVKNTATTPGGYHLTGFTATATNLPAGVSLADIFPNLDFRTSFTNDPQPIANAVDLSKVFPAKPAPAAPQPTTAPVPEGWIPFTHFTIPASALTTREVTATYDAVPIAILDGGVVFNPTVEQKSRERFSDQTLYVSPTGLVNNNYAVTGITNGVLTMKADQTVVAHTLAAEAAAAKRAADRSAFYDGPGGAAKPGEIRISRPGAFGMTKDLFPSIRHAIGHALNLEFLNKTTGEPGSLAKLITGANQAMSWDQISEDQIMAWLADLHTNPAKQAVVMPTLMAYAVNAASLAPGQRSAQDEKLLAFITPALADARASFVGELTSARDAWVESEGASRGATFQGLLNGKMPYDQFIATAVGATMAEAQQSFEAKAQQPGMGGALAAEFGVGTGGLAALDMFVIRESFGKIFPNAKKGFELAAQRAVKAAAEQGVKKVAGDLSAKMAARATSSMAGGVGTILSLSITILISETTAIADNEKAAASFNALLNPATSNDPRTLVQSDAGKAIMMLGMARLFMGGGGS